MLGRNTVKWKGGWGRKGFRVVSCCVIISTTNKEQSSTCHTQPNLKVTTHLQDTAWDISSILLFIIIKVA